MVPFKSALWACFLCALIGLGSAFAYKEHELHQAALETRQELAQAAEVVKKAREVQEEAEKATNACLSLMRFLPKRKGPVAGANVAIMEEGKVCHNCGGP